jgi:hypothetical protein
VIILAQPFLFTVGAIFSRYVALPTTPDTLTRPIVVSLVVAAVILVVLGMISRNWTLAAMLSGALMLFTFRVAMFALVIFALCAWWILISILRRLSKRPPPRKSTLTFLGRATGILSIAYIAVMGASVWIATFDAVPQFQYATYADRGIGGPNIYLLLLDGYPRADTLSGTFSIANEAFYSDLSAMEFDVAVDARANYNKTWTTMASVLNGAYVDSMMGGRDASDSPTGQIRWLQSMINNAGLLDVLRDRGYVIRAIPQPFRSTAMTSADDYIDHGHITEFEGHLINFAPWALAVPDLVRAFLADAQEAGIRDDLETTAATAADRTERPQFVLAHIQNPHTPFVLHEDDVPRPDLPDCIPGGCALWNATIQETETDIATYRHALQVQLDELNSLVVDTVARIVRDDPEAVVILMSDHGLRYSLVDIPEHYRIFLAARTPGQQTVFDDDESPVNVLRALFASYFGTDLAPLPYQAWGSPWTSPLDLAPIDP